MLHCLMIFRARVQLTFRTLLLGGGLLRCRRDTLRAEAASGNCRRGLACILSGCSPGGARAARRRCAERHGRDSLGRSAAAIRAGAFTDPGRRRRRSSGFSFFGIVGARRERARARAAAPAERERRSRRRRLHAQFREQPGRQCRQSGARRHSGRRLCRRSARAGLDQPRRRAARSPRRTCCSCSRARCTPTIS